MKKAAKKLLTFVMAIAMLIGSVPMSAFAADTNSKTEISIKDGMYSVELSEVPSSKSSTSVSYNNFNVAPRAFLNVSGGKYTLVMRVYGYNYWNVVKVLSQEGWKNIETLKPGTDWKDYSGNEMSGYETLAAKSGDEATNKYWKTVEKGEIDKDKNMGLVSISLDNLNDAFAIGGYAVTTYNNKEVNTLVAQGYQLNLSTLSSAQELLYYSLGFGSKPENLQLDYARAIPIASNIEYDNTKTQSGLFADEFVSDTEFSQKDGIITAKFKVSEESAEEIESVQVLENTSIEDALGKTGNSVYFKAFLLGTRGGVYGENVYDSDNKEFTLKFSSDDTVNSLITGIDVKIVTKQNSKGYRAVMYLSNTGMRMTTLEDEKTNTSYTTFEKYILGSKLTVKSGEDANEYAVNDIKNVADGDNWRAYSFYLTDTDGNSFVPHKGGTVRVPIPKEWNLDNTYIGVYTANSKSVTTDSNNWQNYMKIVDDGDERYVEYTVQLNEWIADGSVVMCQILKESDLNTELSEDGTYNVTAKFVKAGAEGVLSMADGCLERDAIVTVKDGKKSIYMNFHPLEIVPGAYSYMGAVWNKESSDSEYYNYETEEDGTLIDNSGFDAITEFPCVKSVKVSLADDSISDNSYKMKVVPPAMAGGSSYEKAMQDAIDVDLKLYNIKKVSDESTVQIPTYQKSVLRKSIDKAERYNESSYSSDSWATLKSALEDGKAYYNTLAGTDAGTDETISNTIKEKSDAIENAIKALEENPELTAARENLKKAIDEARKVELGNKTVSAFNELTAAINSAQATYEKSNVTVEELNKQVETLNAAVETFNNSADASKLNPTNLEDGDYKVYVDMKKIDKATDSMSNNAIDHWINLNVKNGVYTATLDFKGMTVSGQFGYLQTLKYYDAGYTYDSMGNPQGTLKDTTVLSTQKDAQGNDIIDSFNDKDNLYPDLMSFPLVDKGTQEYVPLQVFVPLMESLTAGTGTQDVLMRIDWTSLKTADDDTQEEITLEDGLYTVSSDLREAGSDEKSAFNAYLEKVRLIAKDGKITAYIDFKSNGEGADETYVTDISIVGGSGQAANGKLDRAELTLPQNVEFTNVKLTDNTGKTVDARLYLDLRNAVKQNADKSTLQKFIAKAEDIKKDGKTYTDVSMKVLEDALKTAETVNKDDVAIDNEINAAGLALKGAIDTMEEVKPSADKTALEAKIKEAEAIDNKENVYTEDSYKNLTDAISAAKKVLADENAEQSEVDSQVTLLQAAIDGLQKEAVLNRADLKAMIEKAEALNDKANTFTKDSWDALYVVYNTAVQVYQDKNATQDQIDAQVKALQAAIDALVPVSTGELADGVYEIKGEFQKAEDKTKLSMADGALSYTETTDADGNTVKTKDPLYLVVKDGKISVRMHFVPLTSDWNGTAFTGYLGEIKYYPDYDDTDALPGKDEKLADVNVEYSYIGYDEYNDPDFGSDSYIKGKSYPEVVSIPVELNDNEIWVQVYVPVMEGIAAGNGTQKARLCLDWSSVKQVRDDSIDVSELEKQIGYAKAVEKGTASDATWEALQQAIVSAQAVYDNLSSTQEQIDAQITLLQKAMAAVASENGKKADKTQLQALIGTANEKLAQTNVYTEDSLKTLQTILLYAQGVYDNNDADQTSVDAAAKALKSALDGLAEIKAVDTSALETELSKAEALAAKTDVYTEETLNTLQIAINNAKRVLADENHTQDAVDKQVTALQNAQLGLIKKVYADKTSLKAKLDDAKAYTTNESVYTASSMAALKTAISNAETVYADENASQATVDAQTKALEKAIAALVKAGDNTQDITKLADGVYSIYGTMVKIDKTSASMSNEAINHTIKLTVKNGKYYITLNFNGLTVGQKLGYLSKLKYFTTGYTLDKYGNPQGTLADVTVDSYQKNADGSLVSDTYGSNYPDEVTFELIPEALEDGYVPLQVFVPIMDAISAGTGTQPVFLKLDWSSLKATTADDPDFDKNDNNNNNNGNVNGTISNGSSLGSGQLGNNTLGNSSLGSSLGSGSSLKSGASSLGSGSGLKSASSVKTADMDLNQMRVLWAAVIVAAAAMAFGLAGMFRRRRNGEEQ